jgi:hypothetical protein
MRGVLEPILLGACVVAIALPTFGGSLNGFDLEDAAVPVGEIQRGGPPRDGIRALDDPPVDSLGATPFSEHVMVIGVSLNGEARAYPVPMLERHELVNDTVGGRAILVSFCPLCGTGIVFDRAIEGKPRSFGVSGLLWRSDVLMFDRETESLWSQIDARAITGPSRDRELSMVSSRMTRLEDWAREHPATTVMSPGAAGARAYARSPYPGYDRSREIWFRAPYSTEFHPKTPTLGLRFGSEARAYPAPEVAAAGGLVREEFAGARITVRWDPDNQSFQVEKPDEIEAIQGYWFAWSAFHPETSVFRMRDRGSRAAD